MFTRSVIGLVLAGLASMASAASIDQLYLAPFGNYTQTYATNQLFQLGSADYYVLDDQSTWDSGAGGFFSYRPPFVSESIAGTTIRYRFARPTNGVLWDYDDYDSGDHSSSGVLSLEGNLVLEATVGSKSATLSGYVTITENTYANYTDSRFNFYSAPVGSVVPVTINYTITSNETFTPGLFGRTFEYRTSGVIDFTNVIPVPLAQDDVASTYLGKPVAIDALANDLGFDDPVTVTVLTAPASGLAAVTGSPGSAGTLRIVYTPDPGFTGTDSLVYQVSDGAGSRTATVALTVLDPVAAPDAVVVRKATPVAVPVAANDEGFSDPVTVQITSGPSGGSASVVGSPGAQAGIRIAYTPAASFVGSDSLVYEISDGVNARSATLGISVVDFRANDDFPAVLRDSCCNQLRVLANDIGFGGQVTVTITSPPDANGSVSVRNSPGPRSGVYIEYYPNTYNKPGDYTETFEYEVTDGTFTDRADVTVSVVSFAAQDDAAVTAGDTPVTIGVGANDIGFGYPATFGLFANPGHGTVAVTGTGGSPGSGQLTYIPEPGFLGTDTFQYAIDDGSRIDIATVTVQVIIDADRDGIDDRSDNCLGMANADQRDTDGDRYGNRCDADLNNSGIVNFADVALFRARFASGNADSDFNGDGLTNFGDLAILQSLFGRAPGPTALVP